VSSNKVPHKSRDTKRKMGSANLSILLTLALSLPFFTIIMSFAASPPTVNIMSNVGTRSSPVSINCKVDRYIVVERTYIAGDKFAFQASINGTYYCTAVWNLQFAGFQSFNATRDKSHQSIFWKTTDKGFSLSYDNRCYKLDTPWESE
jgi:hypothetical protein